MRIMYGVLLAYSPATHFLLPYRWKRANSGETEIGPDRPDWIPMRLEFEERMHTCAESGWGRIA